MITILKTILIGPKGVGKTSVMNRYIDDVFTQANEFSTIGVDVKFKNHIINNEHYKLQLWDTAGQERFMPIIKPYYYAANCIIYCFSLHNKMSFLDLDKLIQKYNDIDVPNTKLKILVGIGAEDNTVYDVTDFMIYNLMEKYNIKHYYDISAMTGHNINFMFDQIIGMLINSNMKFKTIDDSTQTPTQTYRKKNEWCNPYCLCVLI